MMPILDELKKPSNTIIATYPGTASAEELRADADPPASVLPEVEIPEAHGGQNGVFRLETGRDEGRFMTILFGLQVLEVVLDERLEQIIF